MPGSRIAPEPSGASSDVDTGRPQGGGPGVSSDAEPAAQGALGARAFLKRPEVRDVLAWMRLLVDPQDAAAVVRALSRPPIELRQVELARVIQVARRRTASGRTARGGEPSLREATLKSAPPAGPPSLREDRQAGRLDFVLGLSAAAESPRVPPEARERIQRFVAIHRSAAGELGSATPDLLLAHLIERLGAHGGALRTPEDAAAQSQSLQRLQLLAGEFVRDAPTASVGDLLRHLDVLAPDAAREPEAGGVAGAQDASERCDRAGRADQAEELHATFQLLREEVIDGVARIGGRLGELRLDTDLDISHGVVRYLELLKLSALLQRPEKQSLGEALADVNARLLAAVTPLQREIFQTSTLDETLVASRVPAGRREEHSLHPFLPRKGIGLALSASDIRTYRSCPLRYKYARVLRIPAEQTVHQRFGIVVHQVLERYHSDGGETLAQMLGLLDAGWRRAGLGDSERELLEKAHAALTRYHARLESQDSLPVWFERQFDFRLGPHHLRGRVDRVDRLACEAGFGGGDAIDGESELADGHELGGEGAVEYELIDYKTSRPKSAEQLSEDIQLSLYALAAREDWGLEPSRVRLAYYYVLDDLKVPVHPAERSAETVEDIVLEVGEGILAEEFQPTPSRAACSMCDYRIVCPAAEA